ncbi:MAG TPA: arginine--tRNA ligase [Verrucomicrobiales bacterium]|nr:arginine--tRNA ligase [Verrucomicrobiales bacterium]
MTPIPALLRQRLDEALELAGLEIPQGFRSSASAATDTRFGDYQSNSAMVLAKEWHRPPRDVAAQLAKLFPADDLFETPEVAGPGFLNFRLCSEALAQGLAAMLEDPRLGVDPVAPTRHVVIDFSSPNVAKPMHVGHIRSTMLGDCLARVARFLGHSVITDNHIGDWGTQFGMIIYGWKHHLHESELESGPIHALLAVYREINGLAKSDPAILDACRAELVKLQQGDPENLAIWKKTVDLSIEGLDRIYGKLDIHFDHYLGESFYNDRLAPLAQELRDRGIAEESAGALCVFFPEVEALRDKPAIIQKSDGAFNYTTSDLAAIDHRLSAFRADEIWYVVGAPQQLHFQQLFAIAQRRGISARLVHVAHGSILGADRKLMKTRSGDNVQLDDLLTEAVERARAVIEEKNPGLDAEEREETARIIGYGAIKYAELSQNRNTDYIFSWEKLLSFHGNTAPYLQNAYVRTRSIFRKLANPEKESLEPALLETPEERALALRLLQFNEAVPAILDDFRPNILASYLYELAQCFHTFYEACPVLTSAGSTRAARLALCELTSRVLRQGLDLLGIRVPERM